MRKFPSYIIFEQHLQTYKSKVRSLCVSSTITVFQKKNKKTVEIKIHFLFALFLWYLKMF